MEPWAPLRHSRPGLRLRRPAHGGRGGEPGGRLDQALVLSERLDERLVWSHGLLCGIPDQDFASVGQHMAGEVGSREAVWTRLSYCPSASMNAWYGAMGSSAAFPTRTSPPSASTWRASSAASRDLPMPGSPVTTTSWRPAGVGPVHALCRRASS